VTKTTGIIVGVSAHKTNIHDSKTLQAVLTNDSSNRETTIAEATEGLKMLRERSSKDKPPLNQ